jgi:hypothetical protein
VLKQRSGSTEQVLKQRSGSREQVLKQRSGSREQVLKQRSGSTKQAMQTWPFHEVPNSAAFSTRFVLEGAVVLRVYHD